MHYGSAIPNRLFQRPRLLELRQPALIFGLFLAASDHLAYASTLSFVPDCSASGNSLKCYLSEFLSFLYVAAGILGLVLIVVILLAINSYRKTKQHEKVDS